MTIDPKFIREVQRAGYHVESVDEDSCVGKCSSPGCGVRLKLKEGSLIPPRFREGFTIDLTIDTYDAGRVALRNRREDLALSIRDVEEIAGLETDHLAKIEKDNPSKLPNVETFIYWANALGYEVVLRPSRLPQRALTIIAETRHMVKSRYRRRRIEAKRRQAAR